MRDNRATCNHLPDGHFHAEEAAEVPIPVTDTADLDRQLSEASKANEHELEHCTYGETFRSPLFCFVRHARGISQLKLASPSEALRVVERWLLRKGYKNTDEGWETEFCMAGIDCAEDARTEFVDLWQRIRFPVGWTPLQAAWDQAQIFRLKPINCPTERYASFISLAGNLQVMRGSEPIWLPCRETAELLDVCEMTISRYRRFAVEDGQLKKIRSHTFRTADNHGEATLFRFDLNRYPDPWYRGVTAEIEASGNSDSESAGTNTSGSLK